MADKPTQKNPWYAGKQQDALIYLLIAIFFIELIVGGISFFYGIMHAAPETAGGPPVARFPWLVWAVAACLAPVALILIVHLAGSLVSYAMTREEAAADAPDAKEVPESMKRFYASVRHAPTVILLLAILLLGAALFFVEGAFKALVQFGKALMPYLPWLVCGIGGLLAVCFIAHCFMVYRQRKMEHEYAWRREVLEKTGLVITDRSSHALTAHGELSSQQSLPGGEKVLDITALPPAENRDSDNKPDKTS